MVNTVYNKKSTSDVQHYVDSLKQNVVKDGVFDSAAADDFTSGALNQNTVTVPQELQVVLDEASADGKASLIQRAILDSCEVYAFQHGASAPADLVELAIHNAYATTENARAVMDSATSLHHDPASLQPNRAVVAILTTISEAIPFAHYLPADIRSNEARLAIMSHRTGSAFGGYGENALLDGVNSGDAYISSSRVNTSKGTGGSISGKITAVQTTMDTCDPDADDLKILKGRTLVYVDGRIAAQEAPNSSATESPISGTIDVGGTTYSITGKINTDTGVYSLTTDPALPDTVPVTVEAFIDFERNPDITPHIISAVETYSLYAKPFRVITRQSMDARTQMANELGLDPMSESVVAINAQFSNERHYEALAKGMRLAQLNTGTFDLDLAVNHQDAQVQLAWRDLDVTLRTLSQKMANDTINHGITHLYVGARVAAYLAGMGNDFFVPSGVTPRPGIHRIGRLFGQYEVYYTPKVVSETDTAAQILCVGKATDVSRNPIVLGDAVPPTVFPLGVMNDMKQGMGFYARNFTCVNPHDPSARGFALIDVNLDVKKTTVVSP